MKRFDPKQYPVECNFEIEPFYVDDLAYIEQIGSMIHMSFAMVHSRDYGDGTKRIKRYTKIQIMIPADQRQTIARQIMNFKQNGAVDLSTFDTTDEMMTAH